MPFQSSNPPAATIQASSTVPPPWSRSCRLGCGPPTGTASPPLRRAESAEPTLPHNASLRRAAGDVQQRRPSVRGQIVTSRVDKLPCPNYIGSANSLVYFTVCSNSSTKHSNHLMFVTRKISFVDQRSAAHVTFTENSDHVCALAAL